MRTNRLNMLLWWRKKSQIFAQFFFYFTFFFVYIHSILIYIFFNLQSIILDYEFDLFANKYTKLLIKSRAVQQFLITLLYIFKMRIAHTWTEHTFETLWKMLHTYILDMRIMHSYIYHIQLSLLNCSYIYYNVSLKNFYVVFN